MNVLSSVILYRLRGATVRGRSILRLTVFSFVICSACFAGVYAHGQEMRVKLTDEMMTNEADVGSPEGMVDEQDLIIGPPVGQPNKTWEINSQYWKRFPLSAYIDLGSERNLSKLWLYDTNANGDVVISSGKPGAWQQVAKYGCNQYLKWASVQLDVTTRYLRITRMTPGANFSEIAVYEYTPEAYKAMLERKAEEARIAAERQAALDRAMEEMKRRPLIDLGEPFGKLYLVDEIDCTADNPGHEFAQDPAGVSRVETILGRPCRVLSKTEGEAAYMTFIIGKMKLLMPGATYVLEIEYPEDAPRSMIVRNGGNETSLGFHTGATVGDALHPKYVDNNNESIATPLSGKYETWRMLFQLHDGFSTYEYPRGSGVRPLKPEDGFPVTIAQFSARNIPISKGAAVSKIRLYAVTGSKSLVQPLRYPPEGLPRRRLFWREEMADGIISSEKEEERGVTDPLDWYRYKANLMKFLGMNTYTKDLLEFGACQHWDPTDGGGNDWVFHSSKHKGLWERIVTLMGEQGFDILPYYEYSGSKGYKGLGQQRRAKPLTRDDAYTHIKWIESANADITDPDTYDDFRKMLDLTILRFTGKANFVGAWIRPRAQLPMGFGDATRARFAAEANNGKAVTRQQLIDDKELLARYESWWFGKREEFLAAMRDHLRKNGAGPDATILYTASSSEPGVSFPTWDKTIVTDNPQLWESILKQKIHQEGDRWVTPLPIERVFSEKLYRDALIAAPLTWGNWEVNHASPPADPENYKQTPGVLMTHAFNRAYTVGLPDTFDLFRGPSGLAIIRHYTLNENMMFDKSDKPKLGYFAVDVERAGPYCMLGEVRAVAYGDPNYIGYLVGANFGRGFPKYVRDFNAAYLALPALPSTVVANASSDPEVIVRAIPTQRHGTYYAVANVGLNAKPNVTITLPGAGRVIDAATGKPMQSQGGRLILSMEPCQLRSFQAE